MDPKAIPNVFLTGMHEISITNIHICISYPKPQITHIKLYIIFLWKVSSVEEFIMILRVWNDRTVSQEEENPLMASSSRLFKFLILYCWTNEGLILLSYTLFQTIHGEFQSSRLQHRLEFCHDNTTFPQYWG